MMFETLDFRTIVLCVGLFCMGALSACSCDDEKTPATTACTPGELSCTCAANDSCGDGLACDRGYCVADANPNNGTNNNPNNGTNNNPNNGTNNNPNNRTNNQNNGTNNSNNGTNNGMVVGAGLDITAAGARSCELVVIDGATAITAVTFGDAVEGRTMRRGDRLALAFYGKGGAELTASSVGLTLKSGADLQALELTRGRCFGADGAEIAGTTFAVRAN